MSEEIKDKLKELGEVFPLLPPFEQGRIIGTIDGVKAMQGRDQPEEEKTA